jgi:hypothetical protein
MTHISVILDQREAFLIPVRSECYKCSSPGTCVETVLRRANIRRRVGAKFEGEDRKIVVPVIVYSIADAETAVECIAKKFA